MFDDNPNREARLRELTSDTQSILAESKTSYADFLSVNQKLNTKLAQVFAQANLQPPALSDTDVLAGTALADDVDTTSAHVQFADIVVDVAGAAALTELAPAATLFLVDAEVLSAETAGTAIAATLGVDITAGSLVGGIVGAVVVGGVSAVVTSALAVFTGDNQRIALKGGIATMRQYRERAALSRDRLRAVVEVENACVAACDAMLLLDDPDLKEAGIENLIRKQAQPALQKLAAIRRKSVVAELYRLDVGRGSWMREG